MDAELNEILNFSSYSGSVLIELRDYIDKEYLPLLALEPKPTGTVILSLESLFTRLSDIIVQEKAPVSLIFILLNDIIYNCHLCHMKSIFHVLEKVALTFKKSLPSNEENDFKNFLSESVKIILFRLPFNFDPEFRGDVQIFLSSTVFPCDLFLRSQEQISSNKISFVTPESFTKNFPFIKNSDFVNQFARLQGFLSNPPIDDISRNDFLDLIHSVLLKRNFFTNTTFTIKKSRKISKNELIKFLPEFETLFNDNNQLQSFLIQILIVFNFTKKHFSKSDRLKREKAEQTENELFKLLTLRHQAIKNILLKSFDWKLPKKLKSPFDGKLSKTDSKSITKTVKKREENEFFFRVWPSERPTDRVIMGNLVLENLWKTNLNQKDNSEGNFEEKMRYARKFYNKRGSETVELERTNLLPSTEKEVSKLKEVENAQEIPNLVAFRLLRLLRESDYQRFQAVRGRLDSFLG